MSDLEYTYTRPDYIKQADNHSLAHDSSSGSVGDFITKGIPAALLAAGNELRNIPSNIGNLVTQSQNYEIISNREVIAQYDDDMMKYYDDHQLGIDVAGFAISSVVPYTAGAKVTRMGTMVLRSTAESGVAGRGLSSALGVVPSTREAYIAAASKDMGATGNAFTAMNTNVIKSITTGAAEAFVEGAIGTAFVNATMYNSPVLNERSVSDLAWDTVTGGLFNTAIMGSAGAIGTVWKTRSGLKGVSSELAQYERQAVPSPSMTESEKIVFNLQQIEAIPAVHPTYEFADRAAKMATKTRDSLLNEVRASLSTLSGNDTKITKYYFDRLKAGDFEDNWREVLGAEFIGRVNKIPKAEKEYHDAVAQLVKKGELLDGAVPDVKISYLDTWRNGVSALAPKHLTFGDIADEIKISRDVVTVGKSQFKQLEGNFNILKSDTNHANARQHWAEATPKFANDGTVKVISEGDIAMLQKAQRDGLSAIKVGDREIVSMDELVTYTHAEQRRVADELIRAGKSLDEAAEIVNAHPMALTGAVEDLTLFNMRDVLRRDLGADVFNNPRYVKVITRGKGTVNGWEQEGLTVLAQRTQEFREAAERVVAANLGEEGAKLPAAEGIRKLARGDTAGPGAFTAEGGNYGTVSSFFSYVGQRASAMMKKANEATHEVFMPTLSKLANNVDDSIAWSTLNETLRGLPSKYFLADDGARLVYMKAPSASAFESEAAFAKALTKHQAALLEAQSAGIPLTIELKSANVRQLVRDHISKNNERKLGLQRININNGNADRFTEGVFYPIPRNPKDTPFFSFVVDNSTKGRGHSQMIYAANAKDLEIMTNDIMSDPNLLARGFKVITKDEAENYYKSIGQFEFEHTLSENHIRNELFRSGKGRSFLPLTDPKKIAEQFLDWHLARDRAYVRSNIEHKYAPEFDLMRKQAAPAVEASKSRFGYVSPLAYAESTVSNPATDLMKLALNVSKIDEYPLWQAANNFADRAVSTAWDKITRIVGSANSVKQLDDVNRALKEHGYKDVIVTEELYSAMNGSVPRGVLDTIVRRANSLLSMFALRTDVYNAINNTVGSAVLLGAETKSVLRAIARGDKDAAGELASLGNLSVPGTGDSMFSATKLIAKQYAKWHNDPAAREWARAYGFNTTVAEQYSQSLDHIALALASGKESHLQSAFDKIKYIGKGAEKWSGNLLAEELNRFVAAGVMKDLTDIAVKRGLMSNGDALTYINTFVNRTQGNYLASQRPIVFQGALGQAAGLFQTYQFNMMQQVFRYVGSGQRKDALTLLALQGGIYGLHGTPAFDAINSSIIAQAGGNTTHKDLYDAVYSGAGKEAAEWIMYGAASNALGLIDSDLKSNMYSRGDINPRHVSILPVSPLDTPLYQASARLYSNIKEVYGKMQNGGDVWTTFVRGLEQNGVSRPLTGIAQILDAAGRDDKKLIAMDTKGNMVAMHDLYSLATLSRFAGAKPLDEAVVSDSLFRSRKYQAADAEKRKLLSETMRQTLVGGGVPSDEQVSEFTEAYMRSGGKQHGYTKFAIDMHKDANVSQAQQLQLKFGQPGNRMRQIIMNGGDE